MFAHWFVLSIAPPVRRGLLLAGLAALAVIAALALLGAPAVAKPAGPAAPGAPPRGAAPKGAVDPGGPSGAGPFPTLRRSLDRPAVISNSNWSNLFPELHAVSVVAPDDAWAGGAVGHLLHFTGGSWQVVDPPALQGGVVADLDMRSASDGWIADYSRAFEYDGTTWTEHSEGLADTQAGGNLSLDRVRAVAAGDAWALAAY